MDDKSSPPFRVGKKQKRVILDSTGHEVAVFSKGREYLASSVCIMLNSIYNSGSDINDYIKTFFNAFELAITFSKCDHEKASLLYAVKAICLQLEITRPKWWYDYRNTIDWIDDQGKFIYNYDLGGFTS